MHCALASVVSLWYSSTICSLWFTPSAAIILCTTLGITTALDVTTAPADAQSEVVTVRRCTLMLTQHLQPSHVSLTAHYCRCRMMHSTIGEAYYKNGTRHVACLHIATLLRPFKPTSMNSAALSLHRSFLLALPVATPSQIMISASRNTTTTAHEI